MARLRSTLWTLCLMACSPAALWVGCGGNYLEKRAPESPIEKAQLLMEDDAFLQARQILATWLESNPDDAQARALYASTYAAEAGVAIIDLTQNSLNGGQQSDQDLIKSILPEATDAHLELVRTAKAEIESIPVEMRNGDMDLQATVYAAAFLLLFIDNLAASTDSPTPEEAAELLTSLDEAEELMRENNLPPTEIAKVRAEIAQSAGATEQEKINSYLEKVRAENGGELPTPPIEGTALSAP
jgi:hypothetical protein